VIEALMEPRYGNPEADKGSFAHRSFSAPPYVKMKARRAGEREGPDLIVSG
jgi:hypothetical protein